MRRTLFLLTISIFLAAGFSPGVRAEDERHRYSPYENEIVSYAGVPYYYKTKEQIAFELFLSALRNVQELQSIGTYSAYLQTFERSLNAVYSVQAPAIRLYATPGMIEKWEGLSPARREAITKKLEELITQSK